MQVLYGTTYTSDIPGSFNKNKSGSEGDTETGKLFYLTALIACVADYGGEVDARGFLNALHNLICAGHNVLDELRGVTVAVHNDLIGLSKGSGGILNDT